MKNLRTSEEMRDELKNSTRRNFNKFNNETLGITEMSSFAQSLHRDQWVPQLFQIVEFLHGLSPSFIDFFPVSIIYSSPIRNSHRSKGFHRNLMLRCLVESI